MELLALKTLENAGRLITKTVLTELLPLPHSLSTVPT